MSVVEPIFIPTASTEAAIRTAIGLAYVAGGGKVMLPNAAITLTAPLPIYPGVQYIGVPLQLSFPTTVPDENWTIVGGTRFVGDGTFNAFEGNATVNGAAPSSWGVGLTCVDFSDIGFVNFVSAIKSGNTNNLGLVYSSIYNIFVQGCTSWAVDLCNSFHCYFGKIQCVNNMHGLHEWSDMAGSVLQPGNSIIEQPFIQTGGGPFAGNPLSRGIAIEANGTSGFLNEILLIRPQVNNFGRSQISQTASFTNGSADIGVSDGTKFAVGLPVVFSSTVAGFTANKGYVVNYVSGNIIRVLNSLQGAPPGLTATATTTSTITSYGMPNIAAIGYSGASVSNLGIIHADLEGAAQAHLYFDAVNHAEVSLGQLGSNPRMQLRSAFHVLMRNTTQSTIVDIDAASYFDFFYMGPRGTSIQNSGMGLWYDNTRSTGNLSLSGLTGDLESRNPTGGAYLYPRVCMGQKVAAQDTTKTLTVADAGLLVFKGAAGQTYTLPTIVTDTSPNSSLVGLIYEVVNAGANSLTFSTDGTQLFNNVAAKTSMTIAAGTMVKVTGAKASDGTLFWAAMASAALP